MTKIHGNATELTWGSELFVALFYQTQWRFASEDRRQSLCSRHVFSPTLK